MHFAIHIRRFRIICRFPLCRSRLADDLSFADHVGAFRLQVVFCIEDDQVCLLLNTVIVQMQSLCRIGSDHIEGLDLLGRSCDRRGHEECVQIFYRGNNRDPITGRVRWIH